MFVIYLFIYLFKLFDRTSCTYTYLLGDNITREALIIDPVLELVDRDLALINQLELKVSQFIIKR